MLVDGNVGGGRGAGRGKGLEHDRGRKATQAGTTHIVAHIDTTEAQGSSLADHINYGEMRRRRG